MFYRYTWTRFLGYNFWEPEEALPSEGHFEQIRTTDRPGVESGCESLGTPGHSRLQDRG